MIFFHLFRFAWPTAKKQQSTHKRALDLVSGSDFERNLHDVSKRIRSRGSRGPPSPEGRKSNEEGPVLYFDLPQGLPSLSMAVASPVVAGWTRMRAVHHGHRPGLLRRVHDVAQPDVDGETLDLLASRQPDQD